MEAFPAISELHFGRRDAHDEAANEPELLTTGYYDFQDAASNIGNGSRFLLLGPKGAGKSAILEHLRLTWADQFDRFFDLWDLRGFPIADVRNVKTGESPGLTRTQNSWEFLILLRVVDSLSSDQGIQDNPRYVELRRYLASQGLLMTSWKTKVVEWARATVKLQSPLFDVGIDLTSRNVNLLQIVEILKRVVADIRIPNLHVIALDGLDSLFFETESQWESISGLIQGVESLNRLFKSNDQNVVIVAALRSDIFNVLPSAETNKLKDYAVELNWAAHELNAASPLWELVLRKVQVNHPAVQSVPEYYLVGVVPIKGRRRGANPVQYVLEYTRMLPRDLIEVLRSIARLYSGPGPVPGARIVAAVKAYCEDYFEGEIFNNLHGVLPRTEEAPRKVAAFRDALRSLSTRFFLFEDVQSELEGVLDPQETTALLRQLFEIGGVGVRAQTGSGQEYTNFIYRRVSGSGFTRRHGFVLHNALTQAWNLKWR